MDYSTCLMALVASRGDELETQLDESLQPHLHRLIELATSFFGPRAIRGRDPGV